jgi:hypothetical protein
MWVFEETLPNGEKLTDVINKTNVRTNHAFHSKVSYEIYSLFFNNYYVIKLFFMAGKC